MEGNQFPTAMAHGPSRAPPVEFFEALEDLIERDNRLRRIMYENIANERPDLNLVLVPVKNRNLEVISDSVTRSYTEFNKITTEDKKSLKAPERELVSIPGKVFKVVKKLLEDADESWTIDNAMRVKILLAPLFFTAVDQEEMEILEEEELQSRESFDSTADDADNLALIRQRLPVMNSGDPMEIGEKNQLKNPVEFKKAKRAFVMEIVEDAKNMDTLMKILFWREAMVGPIGECLNKIDSDFDRITEIGTNVGLHEEKNLLIEDAQENVTKILQIYNHERSKYRFQV